MADSLQDAVACMVDDLSAAQQVIENVTELIEESQTEVEAKIDSEFASIFTALDRREQALLSRAKAISESKLAALLSHAEKLEQALEDLEDTDKQDAVTVDPRETCRLVCSDDPVFEAEEVRGYFLVFVPTIREMRDFHRESNALIEKVSPFIGCPHKS
eukprot:SAG31_NODE_256_length_19032_cov_5.305181_10_plen_159_part_00